MLRTNQAVYKIGDRVRVETFSTKQRGAVYVDVVRTDRRLSLGRLKYPAGAETFRST